MPPKGGTKEVWEKWCTPNLTLSKMTYQEGTVKLINKSLYYYVTGIETCKMKLIITYEPYIREVHRSQKTQ